MSASWSVGELTVNLQNSVDIFLEKYMVALIVTSFLSARSF